jgi:hypothetical protein
MAKGALYEDTPAGHAPLGLSAEEHADVVALFDTAATQPAREAK